MKLQKQWKTSGPQTMLSLGKGYYEFSFASENDLRYVWALGTVSLKSGVYDFSNGQNISICKTSITLMHKYGFS